MKQNEFPFPFTPVEGTRAVVVLSGGQDSVTCLGWALLNFAEVYAIGFKYGQRHTVELEQAAKICKQLNVDYQVHEIASLSLLSDSALVSSDASFSGKHSRLKDLPASFVPNRNALFLTIAHAYAQKLGAQFLVTGVCQMDYSGYPDCRQVFISSLQDTLNLGYQSDISILTPLMHLTKGETFELAEQCGILDLVIEESHTCYQGDRATKHDWGYGCGECPSCRLRHDGYLAFIESKK